MSHRRVSCEWIAGASVAVRSCLSELLNSFSKDALSFEPDVTGGGAVGKAELAAP
jgi:hypothetical protein